MGARPLMSASRESITTNRLPENRSRAIAIDTTAPPAAPMPWRARMVVRKTALGAIATRTEEMMCRKAAATSGILRPRRSLRGPTTSCPTANPKVVAERVTWTWESVIPRSALSAGKVGRYRSMVNGPRPVNRPRVTMVATLRRVLNWSPSGCGIRTPRMQGRQEQTNDTADALDLPLL